MKRKQQLKSGILAILTTVTFWQFSCTKQAPSVEPELPECDCRFPNTGEYGVQVEENGEVKCVVKPCRQPGA